MLNNKKKNFLTKVLVVAGSDSSGGAGVQADLKTLTSLGVYGMTAITALTAQNTLGVHNIFEIPPNFVKEQIDVCLSDIQVNAIKIGMVHSSELIEIIFNSFVYNNVIKNKNIKIILDPVMIAKGGQKLLKIDAINSLQKFIINCNPILTPNLPEAEILTGIKIQNVEQMEIAGKYLLKMGASQVIMKGGHLEGKIITDMLVTNEKTFKLTTKKIETKNTHGTGCTMASAIAAEMSKNDDIKTAFENAHFYVQKAIKCAPNFGKGNGPVNHCHSILSN